MTTPPPMPPVPAEAPARAPTAAHRAEFALLRGTIRALAALPWSTAASVGARLGLLGYAPFRVRRRVVERQVAFAFPEKPADEVRRIARAAYESLGRTTIEAALLPRLTRDELLALLPEVEGYEHVERAMADGRGLIIVAGHLGNWELGAAYVAARGVPLDAIVRRQGNPLFDRYLNDTRRAAGMRVVYDAEAVRRTPRTLKSGGAVGFLVDQGVLGLASTFVPFFGRLAKTPRGPAVFALRLGAPVVFAAALRRPDGRFRLVFEPVTVEPTGDRDADVDRIVAAYTATLERWVRREPGQYFWHHKRWKRQPPGASAEGDPLR